MFSNFRRNEWFVGFSRLGSVFFFLSGCGCMAIPEEGLCVGEDKVGSERLSASVHRPLPHFPLLFRICSLFSRPVLVQASLEGSNALEPNVCG